MKTIGQMVQQLEGLLGTRDITAWEDDFIESVLARSQNGKDTRSLTAKQVETVERIWKKHFA